MAYSSPLTAGTQPVPPAALRNAVALTGACGILAQLLLLRELLSLFSGNELSIGIILANWLALEAAGAALFARFLKGKATTAFCNIQLLFALAVCCGLWQARTLFSTFGYAMGETPGLTAIWLGTLTVLAPSALLHGALFPAAVRLFRGDDNYAKAASSAYIWESAGNIAGALLFIWLLIPVFPPFACAALAMLLSAVSNVIIIGLRNRRMAVVSLCAAILALCLFPFTGTLEQLTLAKRFPGYEVLEHAQSAYGSVTTLKQREQISILNDGELTITSPAFDIEGVEEFTHCALLAHTSPRSLFILGGGAGGIISEALKYDGLAIRYAELNPLLITQVKRHSTAVTEKELSSPSVAIETVDGRKALSTSSGTYDVILIGQATPSTLQANRVFTKEFFALVRSRLNRGGILALRMEGSESYLPDSLARLNLSVLQTLRGVFPSVQVFGGDTNIYLAINADKASVTPAALAARAQQLGLPVKLMTPGHIRLRFTEEKTDKLLSVLATVAAGADNSDFKPRAVLLSLAYWSAAFAPRTAELLDWWAAVSPVRTAAITALFLTVFWFIFRKLGGSNKTAAYVAIATTGAAAMFQNLLIMFLCQSMLGYVYQMAGLFIAAFMTGTLIGNKTASKATSNRLVLSGETFTLMATAAVALFTLAAPSLPPFTLTALAAVMSAAAGFTAGWQFHACCAAIPGGAGYIYAFDLLGGWVGGTIGAILLLPAFGALWSCVLIALLKLFSLAITMEAYENQS